MSFRRFHDDLDDDALDDVEPMQLSEGATTPRLQSRAGSVVHRDPFDATGAPASAGMGGVPASASVSVTSEDGLLASAATRSSQQQQQRGGQSSSTATTPGLGSAATTTTAFPFHAASGASSSASAAGASASAGLAPFPTNAVLAPGNDAVNPYYVDRTASSRTHTRPVTPSRGLSNVSAPMQHSQDELALNLAMDLDDDAAARAAGQNIASQSQSQSQSQYAPDMSPFISSGGGGSGAGNDARVSGAGVFASQSSDQGQPSSTLSRLNSSPAVASGFSSTLPPSSAFARIARLHRQQSASPAGRGPISPRLAGVDSTMPDEILEADDMLADPNQGQNGGEEPSRSKLYVEMEELRHDSAEWAQKARWLRYEQLIDDQGDKWGKLHLSVVSIRSLFELRAGLMTGTMLFDIPAKNLQDIVEVVVDSIALDYRLDDEQNQAISEALALPHSQQHKDINKQLLDWIEHLNSTSKGRKSHFYEAFKRRQRRTSLRLEDMEAGTLASPGPRSAFNSRNRADGNTRAVSLEAAHILVYSNEFLTHTVTAFVRFFQGVSLGDFTRAPLGVRFLFIVMGPSHRHADLIQIGRTMGAVFSDPESLEVLHAAHEREPVIEHLDNFMRRGTMIPGEWDRKIIIGPPRATYESSLSNNSQTTAPVMGTLQARPLAKAQLKRSGRIFGGLINDVRNRLPYYKSDFVDGLNFQTLAAVGFIFFVCYAAALTFGAIMGEKTGNQIGALEMVVATGGCGIFFALFSGQPLMILGGTGPSLIITELIYKFSQDNDLEFLPFRFWIGFWVFVLCVILVATDASYIVVYVTRFTEEIFGILVALIYIVYALQYLAKIYKNFPVDSFTAENANVAVVATIFMVCTAAVGLTLRAFGKSRFLTPGSRGMIANFGILISIFVMVCVDNIWFKSVNTSYLDIPSSISPTCGQDPLPVECGNFTRGWVVNPLGMEKDLPSYIPVAAIIPAVFVTLLMCLEQQIAACITNRFKIVKPTGYHLDLLVMGIMVLICSLLGLPWIVAAAVRCISHTNALSVYTKYTAPGEAPKVEHIIETRVSGILIHALVPMSILLASVLRLIPMPVLYGVFLYMGFSAMFNVQMIKRAALLFTPASQHSNEPYVVHVPTRKMHVFTLIQFVALGVLAGINYSPAALVFPLLVVLLVPLRRVLMPRYFSEQELTYLDN
ncbi:hypothetical protein CAOG_07527 [Capsaspora owczarzaki ATCC 30864]|uniref:Anion exchange protein n=1 Tax=Capsaspora owczarzaki (strain ATCC 30864) TaxID=595528 RepID=A0A0D2UPW8_CAPO3|nr:hypothetical protein CAOG_07527 [Capsaspora owczarzaki ATCC 30864]KJE97041.1 hypothetical protein CAOG_007527 [Capsaspora owczarzaki ATCC 30864]|eukprot:XP_004343401.1 hypothetical protein CAOG_07527 [Capsaspora owczarzaki ATCC 30864]